MKEQWGEQSNFHDEKLHGGGFDGVSMGEDVATMSDTERQEEFVATGDSRYLTPALAHKMELGADLMRRVPGVTDQDIELAAARDQEQEDAEDDRFDGVLGQYGLDYDTVCALSDDERARRFLDGASLRVKSLDDTDVEDVKEFSFRYLLGEVHQNPAVFGELFREAVSYPVDTALKHISTLERVYENVRQQYLSDSSTPVNRTEVLKTLGRIMEDAQHYTQDSVRGDVNALVAFRQMALAQDILQRVQYGWADVEYLAPFRAAPNAFAAWDIDKDRVRVSLRGQDTEVDRMYAVYDSDTTSGKILRREVEDLLPYQMASVDTVVDFDITDVARDMARNGQYLEDFIPEQHPSQEDVEAFLMLQRDSMRKVVRDHFFVQLNELTIPEQWYFLKFLKNTTVSQYAKVGDFTHTFSSDGARTFLSMEHGGQNMGEKILAIGEKYDKETAQQIFAKYAELVDSVNSVEDYLKEQFGDVDLVLARQIAENLLVRGKKTLEMAADKIAALEGVGDEAERLRLKEEIERDVLARLEVVSGTMELMKNAITLSGAKGDIEKMAQMEDVVYEAVDGGVVANDAGLMQEIKEIYRARYVEGENSLLAGRSYEFSEEFFQSIWARFEQRLGVEGAQLHLVTFEDGGAQKPGAFLLVSPRESGDGVELSALNVNPQFAFSQAGFALFEKVLNENVAQGVAVHFDAPLRTSHEYITTYGCVGTGVQVQADEELLVIEKRPDAHYVSKDTEQFTHDRIKEMAQTGDEVDGKIAVFHTRDDKEFPPQVREGTHVVTQSFAVREGAYFLLERR